MWPWGSSAFNSEAISACQSFSNLGGVLGGKIHFIEQFPGQQMRRITPASHNVPKLLFGQAPGFGVL